MLLVAGVAPIVLQTVGPDPVPLDGRWQLSGEGTRFEAYQGREAVRIRNGSAVLRDVSLKDGTIAFDVEVTPHRSFVYLLFRATADGEHEEIYLRPHKSSLPDAVQYSPVWNGESNWQLYHGSGATAAVPFTHRRWMHVRLVLQGRRGALFVGEGHEPDLLISLARGPTAGTSASVPSHRRAAPLRVSRSPPSPISSCGRITCPIGFRPTRSPSHRRG